MTLIVNLAFTSENVQEKATHPSFSSVLIWKHLRGYIIKVVISLVFITTHILSSVLKKLYHRL